MVSQYQHGYSYDLFISYSSRDQQWVRQFADDLVEDVNRFADHDIAAFLDKPRLQSGYLWNEALLAAVTESAILLPILSPRFFQSEYCQKEINTFREVSGVNLGSLHRSRVLPVKCLISAPKDHWLRTIQEAEFCAEGGDGIPLEHQPGTPKYAEVLRKLAYAVAQSLKNVPPKNQSRPAVYVSADFQPATQKLRASLLHKFDVLPENPNSLLTFSKEELEQCLARDFSRCFVSVHGLSDAPLAKPLAKSQLAAARAHQKPRLILASSVPAELLNQGFEWFTSQSDIEDRIGRLWEKPSKIESPGAEPWIYFLCPDRVNKTAAESLLTTLEARGIRVYPSPLDGPADQALQIHVQALDQLDGCLIYYGDIGRDWFDSVFLRILKKIRQCGLPSAIFLAPPPSEHKTHDLRHFGMPIVAEAEAAVRAFPRSGLGAGAN